MADDEQTGGLEIKCEPGSSPESSPKMTIAEECNGAVKSESEQEQDQPLDFSCRKRSRSRSRSPAPSSPRSSVGSGHEENGNLSNDENSRSHSNTSASDSDKIGEPKVAKPGTVPGTVFPGMIPGLLPNFAGLPTAGLSSLAGAAGFLAGMSPTAVASMLDQRKTNQQGSKGSRPFKAYPKDPLSLPLGYPYSLPAFVPISSAQAANSSASDVINAQALNQSSEELFSIYRQQVLKAQDDLRKTKSKTTPPPSTSGAESPPSSSNSPSSTSSTTATSNARKRPRVYPDAAKDESYWDRRRKNNEAAKRSRDARRAKEDEIAIRAAFLEQENLKLRVEVAALKTETTKLRHMLYNS